MVPGGSYAYTPFGVVASGNTPAPFGFTGELHSEGLVYLRARWYDPSVGAFTARDPFAGINTIPNTLHPYMYAADNPLLYTDPSGETWYLSKAQADNLENHLSELGSTLGTVGDYELVVAGLTALLNEKYPIISKTPVGRLIAALILLGSACTGYTSKKVGVVQSLIDNANTPGTTKGIALAYVPDPRPFQMRPAGRVAGQLYALNLETGALYTSLVEPALASALPSSLTLGKAFEVLPDHVLTPIQMPEGYVFQDDFFTRILSREESKMEDSLVTLVGPIANPAIVHCDEGSKNCRVVSP